MFGKTLPIRGGKSSAWLPYAAPEQVQIAAPQNKTWLDQKVGFGSAEHEELVVFLGRVTQHSRTQNGQDRLTVVYDDGDTETRDSPLILPWWVTPLASHG